MRYIGGPLDGKDIRTEFDHLPFIRHSFPNGVYMRPETIETYERRGDYFVHLKAEPYPSMRDKLPKDPK